MAIAFDANLGHNQSFGTSVTTLALTTGAAVASGGFIVMLVAWFHTTATLSSVAGGSLTWVIDKQVQTGTLGVALVSAQAPAGLASGTVITATYSGAVSSSKGIGAVSYTGVATSSPVEGTPNSATGTTAAFTCGSITTVFTDCLIAGACNQSSPTTDLTSTPDSGNGWIEGLDFGSGGNGDSWTQVYKIVSAAGPYNPGGTWSGTPTTWGSVSVAYKAAAAGSPSTTPQAIVVPNTAVVISSSYM